MRYHYASGKQGDGKNDMKGAKSGAGAHLLKSNIIGQENRNGQGKGTRAQVQGIKKKTHR